MPDALPIPTPNAPLLDAMVQLSFEVIGVVSHVAAARELSLTQARVLAILRDRTPTMSELANYLGLDRSSVTGLVDRAVARGLLERVANEADRRSARIALTALGHEVADAGALETGRGVAPLLSRLTVDEREHLSALLSRVGLAPEA